MRIGISRLS
jgi:antitoxin Phd